MGVNMTGEGVSITGISRVRTAPRGDRPRYELRKRTSELSDGTDRFFNEEPVEHIIVKIIIST